MSLLAENINVIQGVDPIDATGAAKNSTAVSLKNAGHVTFVIYTGVLHADASIAVTLAQATDVAFGTTKALSFVAVWRKLTGATSFTKVTVTSNTFNIAAAAHGGGVWMIEVDASNLDRANGYDCVRVALASPGAVSAIYGVLTVLSQLRHAGSGTAMDNALVD